MGDGSTPSSAYDANGNILQMQHWGLLLNSSAQIDDLRYKYEEVSGVQSNRLKAVVDVFNDPATKLGDFRTATTHPQSGTKNLTNIATITDYTYDANGNMVRDYNKAIGNSSNDGIVYNYLNLPSVVTVRNVAGGVKGTIAYTYTASGQKLQKITEEKNVEVNPGVFSDITTNTLYMPAGIVYESKLYSNGALSAQQKWGILQFIGHEEGRIRFKPAEGATAASLQYDYMIKDHLGNVRMVLTDEVKPASVYQATIEDGVRSFEVQLFDKIPETEAAKPTTPSPGFDSDGGNAKVSKLFNISGSDKRVGPGVVLKVMAGDKINAKVQAWYPPSATDNTVYSGAPLLVNNLISALSSGLLGAGSKGTLGELSNTSGILNSPLTSFLSDPDRGYTSGKPKAYLNWILLDEQQLKYVDINNNSGAVQIPAISGSEQKKLLEANGGTDITIAKNGYIYVFVSNESQGAVYFDDLRVEHTAGAILEETHYYPFGLTMAGISTKQVGVLENKNKWNSSSELQQKEFNDGSGLEMYATQFRILDPQVGRFWQMDPRPNQSETMFSSMGNNPIINIDPIGDTIINGQKYEPSNPEAASYATYLDPVEVKSTPKTQISPDVVSTMTLTSCHIPKKNVEIAQNKWWADVTRNLDKENGQVMPPRSAVVNFFLGDREIDDPNKSERPLLYQSGKLLVNADGYIIGPKSSLQGGTVPVSMGGGSAAGRVFWSGGNVAKNAAMNFAKNNGMTTLEMTIAGRVMNAIGPYLPKSISTPIWNALSRNFAKGATGNINVFHNANGVRTTSTWRTIEYPVLQNKNIIYHAVQP